MVDRTRSSEKLSRSELAALFTELADAFENGDEDVAVPVGNKHVRLQPPETVSTEIETVERSSVIRGNQEKVDISLRWKR